jgi:hypothetical protein
MFATGAPASVTVCVTVEEQPAAFVTVTLYVCEAAVCATTVDAVVEPLDQRYELKPAPALSVNEELGQTCVGPVMVVTGGATIGSDVLPLLVQAPLVTETFSVTVPLEPAVKVMLGPLDGEVSVPFATDQAYVAPGCTPTEAAAAAPAQTLAGAAMAAVGFALTVTVCESLALQPLPFVTVTLYVLVLLGETVMVCVVAPVDQR